MEKEGWILLVTHGADTFSHAPEYDRTKRERIQADHLFPHDPMADRPSKHSTGLDTDSYAKLDRSTMRASTRNMKRSRLTSRPGVFVGPFPVLARDPPQRCKRP